MKTDKEKLKNLVFRFILSLLAIIIITMALISCGVGKFVAHADTQEYNYQSKNLFNDDNFVNYGVGSSTFLLTGTNNLYYGFYVDCIVGYTYTVSIHAIGTANRFAVGFINDYPKSGLFVNDYTNLSNFSVGSKITKTAPVGGKYMFIYLSNNGGTLPKIQVERGIVATEYEPYFKYNLLDSSIVCRDYSFEPGEPKSLHFDRFGYDHDSVSVSFIPNNKNSLYGYELPSFSVKLNKIDLWFSTVFSVDNCQIRINEFTGIGTFGNDYYFAFPFDNNFKNRYDILFFAVGNNLNIEFYVNSVLIYHNTFMSQSANSINEFFVNNMPQMYYEHSFDIYIDSFNYNQRLQSPSNFYLENSYSDGYLDGEESGFNNGYADGYTNGYGNGYGSGKDEWYPKGKVDGYNDGYVLGQNAATNAWNSLLPSMLGSIASFFIILLSVEVFGTTLLSLVASIGVFMIVFSFIKKRG